MKVTDIRLIILEDPDRKQGYVKLNRVPNLRRIQYTHNSRMQPSDRNLQQAFLKVATDEDIDGICTTVMTPEQVEILRHQVLGADPFHREGLFQMLHKGTRWVYQRAGWFGDFDNCLWDILGKAAGLPVFALIGKVRASFPAYLTSGDDTIESYLEQIEIAQKHGIEAYKFHTYKGGKADIEIFRKVRDAIGPDYLLINDPVCSYTLEEAIEVGHAMEELNFLWLEEPMHEQKQHQYQALCRELDMPVMGNETLMNDLTISTQWLMSGATDLLRANARFGTTQVLKMAHFAELYDTTVEMNSEGGLFGLVHVHLGCCLDNTGYYEASTTTLNAERGQVWGMTNAPTVVDGHLSPPASPGWGAEWDWDRFDSMTVAVH